MLGKVGASQHLKLKNLYETFEPGFHQGQSTETALFRVTDDLLKTADGGYPSLNLSAAFDTVDHNILLHCFHLIGLSIYNWFSSYQLGRTEHVALGEAKSETHVVTCGMYLHRLGHVISTHGLLLDYCYADDTQVYLKTT